MNIFVMLQNRKDISEVIFRTTQYYELYMFCIMGGCGSGLEPASCYLKVTGLITLICISKCGWVRY